MFSSSSRIKKVITFTVATLAVCMLAAGAMLLARPRTTAADPVCPKDQFPTTNIIYCGLDGPSVADYLISFKSYYNNNSDDQLNNPQHVHKDLQAVYQYGGATKAFVGSMSTSNTFQATAHSDGTITLDSDGRVVGTNMQIAGRWIKPGVSGFTHIVDDVYIRSYKIYFAPTATVPTLVHINPTTGMADFAVWEPCGNLITFTPAPAPVHSLKCDSLTATEADLTSTTVTYKFVALATGQNAPITSYVFDFGDGSSTQTVNTSHGTATATHPYVLTDVARGLTASVTVNATGVASKVCTVPVKIPAKQPPQGGSGGGSTASLQCLQLQSNPQPNTTDTFTFTVTALPTNTSITSYSFHFGNGTSQTVTTSASSTTSQSVTYPAGSTHTATASVTGPLGTFSDNCQTTVTVPAVLAAATTTPAPTALINSGPGSFIGLFGLVSVAGGLFHHFVLRRKFFV